MQDLTKIYQDLYQKHGPQGWWPLLELGYHPEDYTYPRNDAQRFEIAAGAILTQNTNWPNVEKTLLALAEQNLLTPEKILKLETNKLAKIIKSAGYFNQKAKKLQNLAKFTQNLQEKTPKRAELLEIWGIGPETADSILLYAYNVPTFVVDAYTKRIFTRLNLIEPNWKYEEIKAFFEQNLEKDYKLFQEFHALIVAEAKKSIPTLARCKF